MSREGGASPSFADSLSPEQVSGLLKELIDYFQNLKSQINPFRLLLEGREYSYWNQCFFEKQYPSVIESTQNLSLLEKLIEMLTTARDNPSQFQIESFLGKITEIRTQIEDFRSNKNFSLGKISILMRNLKGIMPWVNVPIMPESPVDNTESGVSFTAGVKASFSGGGGSLPAHVTPADHTKQAQEQLDLLSANIFQIHALGWITDEQKDKIIQMITIIKHVHGLENGLKRDLFFHTTCITLAFSSIVTAINALRFEAIDALLNAAAVNRAIDILRPLLPLEEADKPPMAVNRSGSFSSTSVPGHLMLKAPDEIRQTWLTDADIGTYLRPYDSKTLPDGRKVSILSCQSLDRLEVFEFAHTLIDALNGHAGRIRLLMPVTDSAEHAAARAEAAGHAARGESGVDASGGSHWALLGIDLDMSPSLIGKTIRDIQCLYYDPSAHPVPKQILQINRALYLVQTYYQLSSEKQKRIFKLALNVGERDDSSRMTGSSVTSDDVFLAREKHGELQTSLARVKELSQDKFNQVNERDQERSDVVNCGVYMAKMTEYFAQNNDMNPKSEQCKKYRNELKEEVNLYRTQVLSASDTDAPTLAEMVSGGGGCGDSNPVSLASSPGFFSKGAVHKSTRHNSPTEGSSPDEDKLAAAAVG